MTNTFGEGNLQWLGMATETTPGTPASVPTIWVPVDTPVFTPGLTMLVDGSLRGWMAGEIQQVAGKRVDVVTFKTNFYLDSIFAFYRQILGVIDVPTGSADPYTHTTALQNSNSVNGQPQGTTLFFNAMDKTWKMSGAMMSSMKVTMQSEALGTIEVSYTGNPATAINAPTNTPTTAVPMPAWNTIITLAGTAYTANSEVDVTITRSLKPIMTIDGTQNPMAIAAGALTVSGDITGVYQGSTDVNLVDYLTNVQPAFTVVTSPVGDAVHSIGLQFSKMAYDKSSFSATTDYFEIKSTTRMLANVTDAIGGGGSPMKVTLLSAVSTAI
jgi:hypothetical protein